jgi:peptidoglycan/xylan/chitin deacetylase (PgdA/CDA1 family)
MKLPLHLLLPAVEGVPILMYHRVWEHSPDHLTITPAKLREQFAFLRDSGYNSIPLPEFLDAINKKSALPSRSILLTFDDGYYTHSSIVYPLLKEFSFQATFFIIGNTIDGTAPEQKDAINKKMSITDLKKLDPTIVQLALHSYNHISYGGNDLPKITEDLQKNIEVIEKSGCAFHKVLAYPYGQRPKTLSQSTMLKQSLEKSKIMAAFRIGNKPYKLPGNDNYEIKRIDISGNDSIKDFAIKLKKGKLKPF